MSLYTAIEGVRQAVSKDAGAAVTAFRADNRIVQGMEVEIRIGDHVIGADEPPSLGGTGLGPNPVELALASLGSCQAITYRVWAELRQIKVDKITVRVEGDLDLRGFFGVDERVRPGFGEVRVIVSLSGPEPPERYEELRRDVNQYCPVSDIFEKPVSVQTRLEHEAEAQPA